MTDLEYLFAGVLGLWLALQIYYVCRLPGASGLFRWNNFRFLNFWRLFVYDKGHFPHTYRLEYRRFEKRENELSDWQRALILRNPSTLWRVVHAPERLFVMYLGRQIRIAGKTENPRSSYFDVLESHVVRLAGGNGDEAVVYRVVIDYGPNGQPEETLLERRIGDHES